MSILSSAIELVIKIPFVRKIGSRIATNKVCSGVFPRPRAFSLWSHVAKPKNLDVQGPVGEYTTWPMLTDRKFSARHLPPANQSDIDSLPEDAAYNGDPLNASLGEVTALFERKGEMSEDRSSILFMFFAQWFTDSILRIDPTDRRKNTSNHNIDLCQIYGRTEEAARLLRAKNKGGKLESQIIKGEEYPDYLGEVDDQGLWKVKERYVDLPYASPIAIEKIFGDWPKERMHKLYATGLERGNSSVGYVAISTIFMREHNRICDELAQRNPSWDDERLYQTARMINMVILMKLVIDDYINHIAGIELFLFDPTYAEKQDWYRTPWIALEFDLLYRWHGLVPDKLTVNGEPYGHTKYRVNNALLEQVGVAAIINAASTQHAGAISLQNTPDFLLGAEYATIKMGRDFRLRSYNEYRVLFGMDAKTSFDALTDDPALRARLQGLYGDIDKVEFIVGLFAESHGTGELFGKLMFNMVGYDAFTQIYTNPLLAQKIYTPATFTQFGLDLIDDTNTVQDLVDRNVTQDIRAGFSM